MCPILIVEEKMMTVRQVAITSLYYCTVACSVQAVSVLSVRLTEGNERVSFSLTTRETPRRRERCASAVEVSAHFLSSARPSNLNAFIPNAKNHSDCRKVYRFREIYTCLGCCKMSPRLASGYRAFHIARIDHRHDAFYSPSLILEGVRFRPCGKQKKGQGRLHTDPLPLFICNLHRTHARLKAVTCLNI